MTLEEIEDSLPNGFHDAELLGPEADFADRKLRLTMNIDQSDLDTSDPHFRKVEVTLSGVCYWFLESPDHQYKSWLQDRPLSVSGYATKAWPKIMEKLPAELLEAMPSTAFACSFFIDDWNTFLHLAAESAECSWCDSGVETAK